MRNLVTVFLACLVAVSLSFAGQSPRNHSPKKTSKAAHRKQVRKHAKRKHVRAKDVRTGSGYIPITAPGFSKGTSTAHPRPNYHHLLYKSTEPIQFVAGDSKKQAEILLNDPIVAGDTPTIFGAYIRVSDVDNGMPWTPVLVTTTDFQVGSQSIKWQTKEKLTPGNYYFTIYVSYGTRALGTSAVGAHAYCVDVN